MLMGDQIGVFAKLKEDFELFNKSMYGTKYPG